MFGNASCWIKLFIYSGTWELGTPKGLSKTVLNSEVVLPPEWSEVSLYIECPNTQDSAKFIPRVLQ